MASNVVQTLINTRVEQSVDDIEAWVKRLTEPGEALEHTRDADPTLLTEKEAEVLIRYYGTNQTRQEVADAIGVSANRVDNLRQAAEKDLIAAEGTLTVLSDLQRSVRPDPHK